MKNLLKDVIIVITFIILIPVVTIGFLFEMIKDGIEVGRKIETNLLRKLVEK